MLNEEKQDYSSEESEEDLDQAQHSVTEKTPLKKKREFTSQDPDFYSILPEGTPSFRSAFSVVATMAGAGVLGLPFAVRQSGWTGLLLLVIVCFMANYTGKILIRCMYSLKPHRKLRTYHDVGEAAYGKKGYLVTLIFQNSTLVAVGTLFLILSGTNLKLLFDDWFPSNHQPMYIYILGTAAIVWPFMIGLKTMKEISFIAIFGMIATVFTVIVICIFSVIDKEAEPMHTWVEVKSYPFAFATFVFAFGGHNVFPAIQESMRNKRSFDTMLNVSFLLILLLYLPPAYFGYLCFGQNTDSPILENLKTGIVSELAIIAITLHIWFTLPIIDNPVNLWVEEHFQFGTRKFEFLWRLLSRTLLLAMQTVIAIGLPHFGDIMALIGASTVSATIFFFPIFFYLRLFWEKISYKELAWISLVLLFATLGSAIGLYSAIVNLAQDIVNKTFNIPDWVFWMVLLIVTVIGFIINLLLIRQISNIYKKNRNELN